MESITQLESWADEVTMAMCMSLEEWKSLQQKITDLESRSQRNNIHLFSLSEMEETNPVRQFTNIFLKTFLQIPKDFDLKIQQAHRALASKPVPGAPQRPVIINFQEYILQKIWS